MYSVSLAHGQRTVRAEYKAAFNDLAAKLAPVFADTDAGMGYPTDVSLNLLRAITAPGVTAVDALLLTHSATMPRWLKFDLAVAYIRAWYGALNSRMKERNTAWQKIGMILANVEVWSQTGVPSFCADDKANYTPDGMLTTLDGCIKNAYIARQNKGELDLTRLATDPLTFTQMVANMLRHVVANRSDIDHVNLAFIGNRLFAQAVAMQNMQASKTNVSECWYTMPGDVFDDGAYLRLYISKVTPVGEDAPRKQMRHRGRFAKRQAA